MDSAFDGMNEAIFSNPDLSQPAVYIPAGGEARQIQIIFDNAYSDPQGIGIVGVGTSTPMADCKSSDVRFAARGDMLEIMVNGAAVIFIATEVMPDGTGVTTLRLTRG